MVCPDSAKSIVCYGDGVKAYCFLPSAPKTSLQAPSSALRRAITSVIGNASDGDFTMRADENSQNEIGKLSKSFNKMIEKMSGIRLPHSSLQKSRFGNLPTGQKVFLPLEYFRPHLLPAPRSHDMKLDYLQSIIEDCSNLEKEESSFVK